MQNFKFCALSGNHECREIQVNFTFRKECVGKFGEELGEEVWEAVNKVMDGLDMDADLHTSLF